MWNPFKLRELPVIELDYKPTLSYGTSELGLVNLSEQFKGEVEQHEIKFPSDLGEEHPFNFEILEKLYKTFGFFTAVVDKYVDFIIGPGFYVKSKSSRAQKIIEEFMQDIEMDTLLRKWTKEALIKGNGFLEIGGNEKGGVKGLKILDAKYMYIDRDNKGKIKGYNQFKGDFKGFNMSKFVNSEKVIPFKPKQIAHVGFNIIGDNGYGLGIGYPAMSLLDNMLRMMRDEHYLMERKANSPLHAKLGKVDGNIKIIPKPEDVIAYGKQMEIMNKKTNWATDDLVDLKVVDFGNIGGKFAKTLEFDLNMLLYAFQIPGVLMGMANVNEGIAKVQLEAFQRRIQSIQAELEKIIEQKIFKRVLEANGLDVHVEFEWGSPSVLQVEGRMKLISELIKAPATGQAMRMILEDEMINLFKLDKDEWEKLKLEQEQKQEEERKRLETQPQPIVPGQNANFPKKVAPKVEQPKQPKAEELVNIVTNKIDKILNRLDKIEENKTKVTKTKVIYKKSNIIPDYLREEENVVEFIKKVGKEYCVISHKTGKKMGCYPTKAQAEKRLLQIKKFSEKVSLKIKRSNPNYEHEKECVHCTEEFKDINDISEWLGFSYKKYLKHIETALVSYDFNLIKAVNEIELNAGMFTETQVEELRKVLDKGFKDGQGLKEMARQVDNKVKPKDLYRMTAEGDIKLGASGFPILSKSADKRAISIVRSEVTRMANQGAVSFYKKEGIKQVSWVASFGDRTCEICEGKNGQIYEIGKEDEMPAHTNCRCTYSPIVNLK